MTTETTPQKRTTRTKTAKTDDNGTAADELSPPTNVVAALSRVMGELPAIGKEGVGPRDQGSYAYRGIEQITREAQGLFAKYGVVFVPFVTKCKVTPVTVGGKPWTDTQLHVVYNVFGPGGGDDVIQVGPLVGIGRDSNDKGANKAMTQAFKYALLQVLCVADAKDDADAESYEGDADQSAVRTRTRRTRAGNVRRGPVVLAGWDDYDEQRIAHDAYVARAKTLDADQTETMTAWRDERGDYTWPMSLALFTEYDQKLAETLAVEPIIAVPVTTDDTNEAAADACPSCGAIVNDDNPTRTRETEDGKTITECAECSPFPGDDDK